MKLRALCFWALTGLLLIPLGEPSALAYQKDCYATAAVPAYAESDSVPCSEDLSGNIRTSLGTLLTLEDEAHQVGRVEWQNNYEDVAASQTDQILGVTGGSGDLLFAVFCTFSADPSTGVSIKDGTGSAFTIINDPGAAANSNTGILSWVSATGAWKLTTGTNTTCRATGRFQ